MIDPGRITLSGRCSLCGYCQLVCQNSAIEINDSPRINANRCNLCGRCVSACPIAALAFTTGQDAEPVKSVEQTHKSASVDTLVLGSGIGGLLAAALLSKQGVGVAVLEKLDFLGGRFTGFQYQGHQIATGAIHMIPHGPRGPFARTLRSLGIGVRFIKQNIFAEFRFNGRSIVAKTPLDALVIFSHREIIDFLGILLSLLLRKTITPASSFSNWLTSQTSSKRIVSLFSRFINFSISASIDQVTYDELRAFLKNVTILGFTALPAGGCQSIIEKLEDYIIAHGGTIHTRSETTEIILHDGKVHAVRLYDRQNGSETIIECKRIVSDIGVKETIDLISSLDREGHTLYQGEMNKSRALRIFIESDVPLIEHKGIVFCFDTDRLCAAVQLSNFDRSLAAKDKHLIVTYQIMGNGTVHDEIALALKDLHTVFGHKFNQYCRVLSVGVFQEGWPVNRAAQGQDYRSVSPLPGLFLVGDGCKPMGYAMVEGVAKSVEAALAAMTDR